MTTPPPRSPVPHEVSAELRRVVAHWERLAPEATTRASRAVRRLLDDLAHETGRPGPVPDLGPALLPDQLTVLVHDACVAGVPGVRERLTQLRRGV